MKVGIYFSIKLALFSLLCILALLLVCLPALCLAEYDAQGFFKENDAETIFEYDRSKKKRADEEKDVNFDYPFTEKDMQRQIEEAQRKAKEMLDFACREARSRGKSYLRLDCYADREYLCNLYECYGFKLVKKREMFRGVFAALYELKL